MAAGKKKPEDKNTDTLGIERSLRDDAEEHLARSPKYIPDLSGQTPEQLVHELQELRFDNFRIFKSGLLPQAGLFTWDLRSSLGISRRSTS